MNIRKMKNEKSSYQLFLSEMDDRGSLSSLMAVKIGALGRYLPHTHRELCYLFTGIAMKDSTKLFDAAGKRAIACSQVIF